MKHLAFFVACLLAHAPLLAQTPDFAGSFSAEGQYGTVVVNLHRTEDGRYAGTMSNGSLTWQLRGEVFEGALTGTVDTGQSPMAFEAHVSDTQLQLIMVEIGPDGTPLTDQGQELIFARVQSQAGQSGVPATGFPGFSGSANSPGPDPFVGRFTDGQLTLSLQGEAGSYSGQLAMGEEAYPVAARRIGDRVEGTMNAPSGQYGLIITASAGGVVVSNAGTEYSLRRVSVDRGGNTGPAGQPATQPGGAAGPEDNSPLAQQWRAHLAGKKVTYISSYSSNTLGGGGLSSKYVYHLCSDGRFGYSGSDVVSHNVGGTGVDGGGSAGSSNGTWRIITEGQLAGIELRFGNGNTEVYRLDMQNGQTFANGDRVYVTQGEVCN